MVPSRVWTRDRRAQPPRRIGNLSLPSAGTDLRVVRPGPRILRDRHDEGCGDGRANRPIPPGAAPDPREGRAEASKETPSQ
ncbi:MAG: hypothetical protein RIS86_1964 [Planctomycetota bacterium]